MATYVPGNSTVALAYHEPALLVPRQKPATSIKWDNAALDSLGIIALYDNHDGLLRDAKRANPLTLEGDISRNYRGLSLNAGNKESGASIDPGVTFGATDPFTIMCEIYPRANVSLANIFGIARPDSEANPAYDGMRRAFLSYLNNYYFWGGAADWNTGISFDTDGRRHVVGFVGDGTNLRFYRDGVLRAGPQAYPGGLAASLSTLVFGYGHSSQATSTNCDFAWGLLADTAFSAEEMRRWNDNPYRYAKSVNDSPFIFTAGAPPAGRAQINPLRGPIHMRRPV